MRAERGLWYAAGSSAVHRLGKPLLKAYTALGVIGLVTIATRLAWVQLAR